MDGGNRPQTVLADRYVLERLLGRGGMGEVWQATDRLLRRTVAVKLIRLDSADPASQRRFTREAQATAGLSHPNVVTIHDFGFADGDAYMVMECLPGPDLGALVRRAGGLPVADILRHLRDAASGLSAAHEVGILHRDVKPANLMLTQSGSVKILDFGIASLADGSEHLTTAAQVIGTFSYLAPERAMGQEATVQSDLYALGCVAVALLSGKPPFEGTSGQLIFKHLNEAPPRVAALRPDAPAELVDLIDALLAKDPSGRPASAAAVARRADTILRAVEFAPGAMAVPAPEATSLTTLDATVLRPEEPSTVLAPVTALAPTWTAGEPADGAGPATPAAAWAASGSTTQGANGSSGARRRRPLLLLGTGLAAASLVGVLAWAQPHLGTAPAALAPTAGAVAANAAPLGAPSGATSVVTTGPADAGPSVGVPASAETTPGVAPVVVAGQAQPAAPQAPAQGPGTTTTTVVRGTTTTTTVPATTTKPATTPTTSKPATTTQPATTTTTSKPATTTTITKPATTTSSASSVTVSKGARINTAQCTNASCAYIVVTTNGFSGTVSCTLRWMGQTAGSWAQGPNERRQTPYYYGYPGQSVTVTCNGVSGSLVW